MPSLRPDLARYVESTFPGARVDAVAGDASERQFFRVRSRGGASHVLMDYGVPFEGETDDIRMARIFQEAGLPVARILEVVPSIGCLVLEDLGAETLEHALGRLTAPGAAAERERFYERAVDLAVAVAVRGTEALERARPRSGPALDTDRFRFEMDFFVEHYARGLHGLRSLPAGLVPALHDLADLAAETPRRVLCHRDFHSRNLMVLGDGSLTMVDIQDARWGPDTYDLASLLRDAYVDLEEDLVERMIERYRSSLPGPPEAGPFRSRFDRVSAQRMIKALGTFGCQVAEKGRRRYLEGIPRTVARLGRLLPRLAETARLASLLGEAGLLSAPPLHP